MDRKTVRRAHEARATTRPGHGQMFSSATDGDKQHREVSRFHGPDTPAAIVVDDTLRTTMRRQRRGRLTHDHQGSGRAGSVHVAGGVPTARVCVRQRLTTRRTAALTPLAERLGEGGLGVTKERCV